MEHEGAWRTAHEAWTVLQVDSLMTRGFVDDSPVSCEAQLFSIRQTAKQQESPTCYQRHFFCLAPNGEYLVSGAKGAQCGRLITVRLLRVVVAQHTMCRYCEPVCLCKQTCMSTMLAMLACKCPHSSSHLTWEKQVGVELGHAYSSPMARVAEV